MNETRIHELLTLTLQMLEKSEAHVLFSVSENGCHINIMDKGFSVDFDSDYDGIYHFNPQTGDCETEYQRCVNHLERLLAKSSNDNENISEELT